MICLNSPINPVRLEQNNSPFADNIWSASTCENVFHILLKFLSCCAPENESTLFQWMVCHRTGDTPLPEAMIALLTHWGQVTQTCVGKLTIIGSDNGLSPGRRQAIIWTNARILLIRPLGTNFSEILIGIQTFSFKKMHLKMSSAKCRLFCLGLNELIDP